MFNEYFQGRILVVAPHYDDEVIGCGGTLIRFRSQIKWLVVVHLTSQSNIRLMEFKQIHKLLAIDAHYVLNQEDGFCTQSNREAVLSLVNIIQIEHPDVVLTPHQDEAHIDHQAASLLTVDAIQKARFWEMPPPATPHRVPTLMEYEVWTALLCPSIIYDVTSVFETKCELLKCYSSQINAFPYIEYIHSLNSWRGILFNRKGQAEAFCVRGF
ncbi:N-acetylglucosaminylphosphatidylinositol deacetylase [Beggiatoa sp. PS]|nr:N-acetylglucosaminylphosphatidylinositol deacetylase [Beggiatoa sp. PS]